MVIATFVLLLAAHILADFVFQTDRLLRVKSKWWGFGLHISIVILSTVLIVGTLDPIALGVIAVTHAALDFWKLWNAKRVDGLSDFTAFNIDQIGHVTVLILVAALMPYLYAEGFWGSDHGRALLAVFQLTPAAYWLGVTLIAGWFLAVRVGGIVIKKMFEGFAGEFEPKEDGLVRGGLYIGYLERSLVYFLVLVGQIGTIGFLIAAKSFLRIGTAREREASEYVIIGTLASFGWALITAWPVRYILEQMAV